MRSFSRIFIGIVFLILMYCPAHAANVLYYADLFNGTDYVLPALTAGGHTVTQATDWADFDTQLTGGGVDLVIALRQGYLSGPDLTTLTNFITSGGCAIFTDWSKDANFGALFGATYTGNDNQTPATITDAALAAGVTNPVALANTGWGIWSMGLSTSGSGSSSGTFPNGDSCLVSNFGGKTLLLGFLADTLPAADGQQFFENAIGSVLSSGTPATPIPTINEWGMILMSLVLAGSALWMIRRRQIT